MHQVKVAALLAVLAFGPLASGPALAQGGPTLAKPPSGGAVRLSPNVGAGQSPSDAAHDNLPNHTRATLNAKPSKNPNQPGDAASDGTAGESSPRAPEPKADGS